MLISAIVKSQRAILIAMKLPILGVEPNNCQTFEHIFDIMGDKFFSVHANFYVPMCNSKITSVDLFIGMSKMRLV